MACPRCGCRMLSKLGRGTQGGLICCDCGFQLETKRAAGERLSQRSLLMTAGLLSLFALTAAVLMTLNDHSNPSLLNASPLDLQERQDLRRNDERSHRFNSVLPRPGSQRN